MTRIQQEHVMAEPTVWIETRIGAHEDPEKVMEVKVGINTSDDFIETLIPYATVRFSKYSRGILFSSGSL